MWVRRKELAELAADVQRLIDGQKVDMRDHKEGALSMLKNDIHTLATSLHEQAANLQKEKAALADALADISHQLKTPLTAMMMMAELLENAPPDKAVEFTANLKQGLAQTGWLVNTLLKMAKLDSGAVSFNLGAVPARELVELALQPLLILLEIKNQRVQWHQPEGVPSPGVSEPSQRMDFFCDKNWTAEAVTNIIKNASEHSPVGSIIEITAGVNPLYKWLAVTDAGSGIPKTEIKRLFQRFGGSQREAGTGIGLPLALAVMRGQNGDIEVDGGGDGKGATFELRFYL